MQLTKDFAASWLTARHSRFHAGALHAALLEQARRDLYIKEVSWAKAHDDLTTRDLTDPVNWQYLGNDLADMNAKAALGMHPS